MTKSLLALSLLACACSSDDKKAVDDAPVQHDARLLDAPGGGDAAGDGPTFLDAPANTAPLTVKNYLSWCSVSVNGGAASTLDIQMVNVMPGTIALTATALTGFKIDTNMWHHTAGDTGGGDTGTVTGSGMNAQSATTVVVASSAKCVWVCCPFLNGTGCTPPTDPCP